MGRAAAVLLALPSDLLLGLITNWPGRSGRAIRRLYWGSRLRHLGRGVAIDEGVAIENPSWISIGARTWIDRGAVLIGGPPRPGREVAHRPNPEFVGTAGELTIGQECHIGAYVVISGMGGVQIGDGVTVSVGGRIYSLSHHYRSFERPEDETFGFGSMISDARQVLVSGPVTLETDAAVAADCLILPGSQIGRAAFIMPRSVVRGVVASGRVVDGNPAREVGARYAAPPTKQA